MAVKGTELVIELALSMLERHGLEASSPELRPGGSYGPRLMPSAMVVDRAFEIATLAATRAVELMEGTGNGE